MMPNLMHEKTSNMLQSKEVANHIRDKVLKHNFLTNNPKLNIPPNHKSIFY